METVEVPFHEYEHNSPAAPAPPTRLLVGEEPSNPSSGATGWQEMSQDAWEMDLLGGAETGGRRVQSQFEPLEYHDPQTNTATREPVVWASNLVTQL